MELLEYGSDDASNLVLRVSITHCIASLATREVVPNALTEMDVAARNSSNPKIFEKTLSSVQKALHELLLRFPNARVLHLFFAEPSSLAFQIGATLNPTIVPQFHTYQY